MTLNLFYVACTVVFVTSFHMFVEVKALQGLCLMFIIFDFKIIFYVYVNALWVQSTSSFRRPSLRSSPCFIQCTPGVGLRTDPYSIFHK